MTTLNIYLLADLDISIRLIDGLMTARNYFYSEALGVAASFAPYASCTSTWSWKMEQNRSHADAFHISGSSRVMQYG